MQNEMFYAFLVSHMIPSVHLGGGIITLPVMQCSVSVRLHGSAPIYFCYMVYGQTEGTAAAVIMLERTGSN
jgi:hypothetical protein